MPALNFFESLTHRLPTAASEFIVYAGCSALALSMDMFTLILGLRLGAPLALAAAAGFAVGLVMVYVLSTRWAFKQRAIQDKRLEFLLFLGIGLAGLLLTELLLWALVQQVGFAVPQAKFATAGAVFLFNFSTRKALLFGRRAVKKAVFA